MRRVYLSDHAIERLSQRLTSHGLGVSDVFFVLKIGFHEAKKDAWDTQRATWNYAIRGKTLDGFNLRVPVALEAEENGVVVITIISLDWED
jgi:hypothetical protein